MQAEIGVIGGSGFYELFGDARQVPVNTPYGDPSDQVVVGEVQGRRVAFIPRHGRDHRFPPHRIPYQANLWALRSLGVRQVLAPCAVGGLRTGLGPGSLVVPDQLLDRTSGRARTFFDEGAVHVPFADPYCARGRAAAVRVASEDGWPVADGGTMVVIDGPRFNTRAESESYSAQGCAIVNMTGLPEAALARELEVCYTAIALVTDLDAGIDDGQAAVTQSEVFRVFAESTERLRATVLRVLGALPADDACACRRALEGIDVQLELP